MKLIKRLGNTILSMTTIKLYYELKYIERIDNTRNIFIRYLNSNNTFAEFPLKGNYNCWKAADLKSFVVLNSANVPILTCTTVALNKYIYSTCNDILSTTNKELLGVINYDS